MSAPRTASTFAPPVMEARRWLEGAVFPPDRPLINVSQAAPVDPPPAGLREEMARLEVANSMGEDQPHHEGTGLGSQLIEAFSTRSRGVDAA